MILIQCFPNRYVTDKEKAGTIRRQQAYRKRLLEDGMRERSFTLTDAEDAKLREIVAVWREVKTDLPTTVISAYMKIK